MNDLFVPLKREFYQAFVDGTKGEEYRPHGPRWNERTCPLGRRVTLSLGYAVKFRTRGTITGFRLDGAITETPAWIQCYGKKRGLAACIRIRIDKPMEGGWIYFSEQMPPLDTLVRVSDGKATTACLSVRTIHDILGDSRLVWWQPQTGRYVRERSPWIRWQPVDPATV